MSGTISATVASLIAAAVGAAGVGTGLYESSKSSDEQQAAQAAQQKALLAQQQAAANQANLTKQEAVLGAQGQAQQQTGGSLTDPGTTALTDLLAGYPGYQGGSSASGTPAATGSTSGGVPSSGIPGSGSGGPPDIAAILAALRNQGNSPFGGPGGASGNLSGGNWSTQPAAPSTYFELANPPL